MYKTSLNIGTLAGLMAFGLFVALYYIGFTPLGPGKLLGLWIPIAAVVWTNLYMRNRVLGGKITYLQAFVSGILTILVWSTCKGFCMYIFIMLGNQRVITQYTDFMQHYVHFVENITGENMSEQIDLEKLIAEATPWKLMVGDISNNISFGVFICFIISFITARSPGK